ncbi:MAG TPA: hypothetical protein VLF91_03725 [Candidatus Saccharimonadales bacterium]|nr:hypothetical protein [Candidatus Saccharimonadales bacterium]
MYFVSSDQAGRNRAFEQLIADTEAGLNDPATRLPADAPDFRQMLADSFLPNVKDGRATIPPSLQQAAGRIAVLPMTRWEIQSGIDVTPVIYHYGLRQAIDTAMYEEICGMRITDDVLLRGVLREHDSRNLKDERSLKPQKQPFEATTEARAYAIHKISLKDEAFRAGVPIIQYQAEKLTLYDCVCTAAVALHEYQHVADAQRWGAFFRTRPALTATELKAYETSRYVLNGRYPDWGVARSATQVAMIQGMYGPRANLRHANPAVMAKMREAGFVKPGSR